MTIATPALDNDQSSKANHRTFVIHIPQHATKQRKQAKGGKKKSSDSVNKLHMFRGESCKGVIELHRNMHGWRVILPGKGWSNPWVEGEFTERRSQADWYWRGHKSVLLADMVAPPLLTKSDFINQPFKSYCCRSFPPQRSRVQINLERNAEKNNFWSIISIMS